MAKWMKCKKCGEEFELKPGKPGFANVCEECSGLHIPAPAPPPKPPAQPKVKQPRQYKSPAHAYRAMRRTFGELESALKGAGLNEEAEMVSNYRKNFLNGGK